jgi:hypothetical protein
MKRAAIFAVAALAAGSIGAVPVIAASAPAVAPSVVRANSSAGASAETAETRIQFVIDKAVDEALKPGGMEKLVSLFGNAQQGKIEKSSTYSQGYGSKLDARIESVRKAWHAKYGHDFSAAKSPELLNPMFATIRTEKPGKNGEMETGLVSIKNGKGATEYAVPLIRNGKNEWKIEVPDSLTAQRLRSNLGAELKMVENESAHWPANEADGYRMATHHVLMAVLDRPMSAIASPSADASVRPASKTSAASSTTSHWWKFWEW